MRAILIDELSVGFVRGPNVQMTEKSMPYVAWNFENDICDEENRQDGIIIVARQSEVLGETGQLGVAYRIIFFG